MPNKEKISVVIPTYNRADTLGLAVKSVLEQTYPVDEIIVCDDGSTDNSKQLISDLKNEKVIWLDCGKNGGPAIPRNKGIKQSKGDWVAFLDSDDEWLPDKIAMQMNALDQKKVKAVCSNANKVRKGISNGLLSEFDKDIVSFADMMIANWVICSSMVVDKKLLLDVSLFPEEKKFIAIEDYALWLRLIVYTDFAFIRKPLVNYQDNNETSIRSKYTDSWVIMDVVFADLKEWLRGRELSPERKKLLKKNYRRIANKGIPTNYEVFRDRWNSRIDRVLKVKKGK